MKSAVNQKDIKLHCKNFWVKVTMGVILSHTVFDNSNPYVVIITRGSSYPCWVVVTQFCCHNPPSLE